MRTLKWVVVIASIVALGFTQEWIKVALNFHIEKGMTEPGFFEMTPDQRIAILEEIKNDNPFDYYQSHETIDLYAYLSLSQLKALKWVLTLGFVVIFYFLNRWIIDILIHVKILRKWLTYTYIGAFSTALLIYALGVLTGYSDLFYMVSRKMVGALQSPIPAIMTWAGWRLYTDHNSVKK
ncbi:MAG: hypothetical protein ACOYLH_04165 [Flavobacteriales bacterium]|jgi:hypothetical protein